MAETLDYDQVLFLVYGIEDASDELRLPAGKVYELMSESSLIELILEGYDVLHTQGTEYLLDMILDWLNRWSVRVK